MQRRDSSIESRTTGIVLLAKCSSKTKTTATLEGG